jgi:ATP-dependent protease ClpP protease subunit
LEELSVVVRVSTDLTLPHDKALEHAGHLYLVGSVDDEKCLEIAQTLTRLTEMWKGSAKPWPMFTIHINTQGGSVPAGLHLGAAIIEAQNKGFIVNTHVVGIAYSFGLTLAQFGNERTIDAMSQVMTHDVQWGWTSTDATIHESRIEGMKQMRTIIAKILAYRNSAGFTDPSWWISHYLRSGEAYWDAEAALNLGLFDKITGGWPRFPEIKKTEEVDAIPES